LSTLPRSRQGNKSTAQDSILRCEDVELKVGHKTLLRSVKINLAQGQSLALTGPNGLGKTTLLRCLAGISRPASGKVWVCEQEIWPTRNVTQECKAVFLASQPALMNEHSVEGNLEFMCNSFGYKPDLVEIQVALKKVGLEGRHSQVSRTLSTGQKRRLTLAFAFILKPKFLIADEPTNGLDLDGVELCQDIFAHLMDQHDTALLTATHDQRLIEWCQTIVPLKSFSSKPSEQKTSIVGSVFL
jgi:heme ABC exporter ATP-binding subunit CcmA